MLGRSRGLLTTDTALGKDLTMNSVNWGGEAYSHHSGFKLTWELPSGGETSNDVNILIGDPGIHHSNEVAEEVVRLWKAANRRGPFVIRMGSSVHFSGIVTKVEMSDDAGTWKTLPSNGAAIMVPGNDGLCAWRS